ncbi:mannose-1-phosphate guanylyltransferase, partial [Beggiatoa alba]|nr:mannose-1-phosphate guanylyltransferase [Beggiatoa alba]
MVPNPKHHPRGDFVLQAGYVLEQGLKQTATPRLTFSGIGIYRPQLFAPCLAGKFPLAPLLRQAMLQHQVTGEVHCGTWLDVGTADRLHAAEVLLHARDTK